jgi:hypothetical protein
MNCVIAAVDRLVVLSSARWSEFLGGGRQRFDSFVSENEQGGNRPQSCAHRFITAGLADAADNLFDPQFF